MAFAAAPVVARAAAGKAGRKAAGGKAATRRAPAGRLPAAGTKARAQRDAIDAIKAQRQEPEGQQEITAPVELEGQPSAATSPRGGRLPMTASNTGGGLVLGGFVYILGLTYLRSGREGVKAWLKAKFLNEVAR